MSKSTFSTDAYSKAVVNHPIIVILISLLLVVASVIGIRNIAFSTDYRVFFSEQNEQLLAFEELQNTFTKNDNIFVVIHDEDKSLFNPTSLSAIELFTEEAWQTPFSIRVDSLTNFQHTTAGDNDLIVDNLINDGAALTAVEVENVREIALNDDRLVERLISKDGRTGSINITLQLPGESRTEVPEAVAHVRAQIAEIETQYPNLQFRLTGNVMLSNALAEATIVDLKSLVPLMYGAIAICVLLLFRSISATILTSVMVLVSMFSAIGMAGWLGIVLTPPSSSAPTIIMTLGVAGSIHVLSSFFLSMNAGLVKKDAMIDSLKVNIEPVFLTVLTTVIGFLSMNFSDTPPLRDLGTISAIGILYTLVFTLFTLPAASMLLPFKKSSSGFKVNKILEPTANFVIRHHRPLLWSVAGLSILIASFIPRMELNEQYIDYFDESIEFRQDTDFAMEHLTGIYKIEYMLQVSENGGISQPEFLNEVKDFADWFREQPEVVHVQSIVETIETLNKNLHADDASFKRLPEDRDLVAQYLLLYEMSLPYGLDMNSQISIGKDATKLTVMLQNLSTSQLIDIENRARAWLASNTSIMETSEGTGSSVVFAHMAERSINSMIGGSILAIFLIGVVLMIALKSIKYGAISMVPNLLPSAIAFGIWAMFVGEMGFALSVMIAMTLGIVVDDTIHFLSKYIRGRKEQNLSPEDAIRYAYSTVGVALVITTIVLVIGFLILSQSHFLPNAGMSTLTVITISVALILDLFLLPPLLMAIDKSSNQPELAAEAH